MASKVKIALGVLGGGIAVVSVAVGGAYLWASSTASAVLSQKWEAHTVDFPIPFPLTEAEIAELREQKAAELAAVAPPPEPASKKGPPVEAAPPPDPLEGVDLGAIALERARERGKHLVGSRFVCVECHGEDFAGGTMVDDPAMGKLLGPNLTAGGKTKDYTPADWDRAVRHGILPDGTGSLMPSEDFMGMSDRELSDVISYIRSYPASDAEVPKSTLGPVGMMLMATGQFVPAAAKHHDHQAAHAVEPPDTAVNAEFGKHVMQVCTGCHRETLDGGKIVQGPPDWPPAGNLTPHEEGLKGWTYEQFVTLLREGKRPDGTMVQAPMDLLPKYAANMTDTELQAMWAYLQTVPPLPDGQ